VYRNAMVAVLEFTPATTEQSKPKPRHSSRNSAAPSPGGTATVASVDPAMPSDIPTSAPQAAGEAGQTTPPFARAIAETFKKERKNKVVAPGENKSSGKEREKSGAALGEDKATIVAKAKAAKALETRPGFASREDADIWLRATLEGDPALENLAVAYEQEVNTQLLGDTDKLVDHSASIKRELARTKFQLFPEIWPGWKPTEHELPGLLVAIAFLCLGAPFCY